MRGQLLCLLAASCVQEAVGQCTPSTVAGFPCMTDTEVSNLTLHYRYDPAETRVFVFVVSQSSGWLGVGFPTMAGEMAPAKAVIYRETATDLDAAGYRISSMAAADVVEDAGVLTELGIDDASGGNIQDTALSFLEFSFVIPADVSTLMPVNIARGMTDLKLGKHDGAAALTIDFSAATVAPPVPVPSPPTPPSVGLCTPSTVAGFPCMTDIEVSNLTLHYRYDPAEGRVFMYVVSQSSGWLGVGFPTMAGEMAPAKAVIYRETATDLGAAGYRISSMAAADVVEDAGVLTELGIDDASGGSIQDTALSFLEFSFVIPADVSTLMPVNIARGMTDLKLGKHDGAAALTIDFIAATVAPPVPVPSPPTPPSVGLCTPSTVAGFPCMTDTEVPNLTLHYRYDSAEGRAFVYVVSQSSGWLGVGFPTMAGEMAPAKAVIYRETATDLDAAGYRISSMAAADVVEDAGVLTELGIDDASGGNIQDTALSFLEFSFVIPADVSTLMPVNIARGMTDLKLGKHDGAAALTIDFYAATVGGGGVSPPVPEPSPPTPGGTPPPAFEDCTQSTMPAYSCMIRMRDYDTMHDMTLHYKYVRTLNASENRLALFVVSENSGWLAVGFPTLSGHMSPAEAVIYRKRDVEQTESMEIGAVGYHISSTRRTGVVEDHANVLTKLGMSALLPPIGGVIVENGFTFLQVSIRLPLEDAKATPVNIARSKNNLELVSHDHDDAVALTINFDSHTVSRSVNTHPEKRERHGACMVAAFGFLFPLGVIAKHYGNDLGLGVKAYYIHLVFSCVGIVLVCYAFMVAAANFGDNYERDYGDHNQAGYFLFVAIIVQPLLGGASALVVKELQPKEPSILRTFHRIFGYCILLGALYQCFSGFEKMKKTVLGSESTRTTLEIMLVFAVIFYCCLVPFMEIRRRRAAAAKMAAASLRSSDTPAMS